MWACSDCGAEYDKLHDARWNCPCRQSPDAARLRRLRRLRQVGSLFLRIPLSGALGVLVGPAVAFLLDEPFASLLEDALAGVLVGLVVGLFWGLLSWHSYPRLFQRPGLQGQANSEELPGHAVGIADPNS